MNTWTSSLLSDSRSIVDELLCEPLEDLEALTSQVRSYRELVHSAARPMTDVDLADALSDATLELLERTAKAPRAVRRLVQVAARYFVLQDDGDDDLTSPYGFDDDVEVFNAVVEALGEPHRALAY
ncbi:MAG TPA: hypothetical protein ENK18_13525 [Deltaproteobacteria bacterium]|nr:hypothetical protein [Deltaproteobacteria bacterium]